MGSAELSSSAPDAITVGRRTGPQAAAAASPFLPFLCSSQRPPRSDGLRQPSLLQVLYWNFLPTYPRRQPMNFLRHIPLARTGCLQPAMVQVGPSVAAGVALAAAFAALGAAVFFGAFLVFSSAMRNRRMRPP